MSSELHDISTPALVVDLDAFEHNVMIMAAHLPGRTLRPHVKAFKCTSLARRLAEVGHVGFCAATTREIIGMASVGLGQDLLLANEVIDPRHLRALADCDARVTIAVDSDATVDAAAANGIEEVIIDVAVGMPRCGCLVDEAGGLADRARAHGLEVRGVMGYEGHLMLEPLEGKARRVEESMHLLLDAHAVVGGDVISGGGTGTYAINEWCTEIQAGSYTLMDTAYAALDLPFLQALSLHLTVISVHPDGWCVADGGLKCLGMDHGDPAMDGYRVWFCSDEHLTFSPEPGTEMPTVGDRVQVWPAHVDPTVASHERLQVVRGASVVDEWEIDLRGW